MHSRDWPLVAREEELAVVFDSLRGDGSAGIVLGGEAGVGKTRLAAEAVRRWQAHGWPVVTTAASRSFAAIPFGALAELVPDPRDQVPGSSLLAVLRAVATELRRRADGVRILLSIDDAHQLDEASAAAIGHVVRQGAATLLITVRSGEPAPDAVQALWKDDLLDRLDLQPLGRRDVERLAEVALGGILDPASVQRIHTATGGNFLLLRELLFAALDSGALHEVGGVWRWTAAPFSSPRLTELVASRVGNRPEPQRHALELAALGEPLELALLVELVGRDAVAALEEDGLLVADRDGIRARVRLIHPIYGTVIVGNLAPSRADDQRLALARALEATGGRRRTDLLRAATWRLEAGEVPGPEIAVPAATMANRLFDVALARRMGEIALRAGAGVDAAIAVASAAVQQSGFAEAEKVLAAHEDGVQTFEQGLAYLPLRVQVLSSLGRGDDALAVLDHVAARTADDARWVHLVAAMRASVHARARRWPDVLAHGQPLLEEEGVDERVMLLAVNPVTMTLCLQGRTSTCLALGDKAIEPALRLVNELPDALGWAAAARVSAMLYAGDFEELDTFLLSIYEDALTRGDDALVAQIALALGSSRLSRGLCRQAVDWLSKAAAVLRQGDPDGYGRMCLALLAEASVIAGDIEGARRWLAEAASWPALHATQSSETLLVEAWLGAMAGDTTAPPAMLVAAAGTGGFPPVEEAQLLHHALRLGSEDRAGLVRLAELGSGVEAAVMLAWGAHAAAVLDGSGAALEATAERFAALSMWLVAAESGAQASRGFGAAGLADAARRSAARAADWFGQAEAARTPLLVEVTSPVKMSRREREVGLLAAEGLSNAEIADRLFLSVRTVESHLYRLFGKLGVERREDLGGFTLG